VLKVAQTAAHASAIAHASNADNWCERLEAYDVALAAIERRYPVLDPGSAAFDAETMLSVYEWMLCLIRQGAEPKVALANAVIDLLGDR
jgi:hypothetical protein